MPDRNISNAAEQLMRMTRNSLIVNMRFMDIPISRLSLEESVEVSCIAADGKTIVYNPLPLLKRYKTEKNMVLRGYLHSLLHCIFQHFHVEGVKKREYWDLVTDIAVENIINELDFPALDVARADEQKREVLQLQKEVKYLTAEFLYRHLEDKKLEEDEMSRLSKLFSCDEHDLWYRPQSAFNSFSSLTDECSDRQTRKAEESGAANRFAEHSSAGSMLREWKQISERIEMDIRNFLNQRGHKSENLLQNLKEVNREKYDYTAFLKKFACMGEVMKVNEDEFDYIFYTYGLQKYKKMPLIEPLEYKEMKRIKEFVIAIDTSGSTSGELVQTFIQKTYNILKQEESFFTKINLHIVQCDDEIQEDVKITSQEEFDAYLKNMKIRGLGGTDFRPVFNYVDELISKKEFTNLKGLIYFTDGYGRFPSRKPEYSVAVVYIDEEYNNPEVPVWAIKLILQPEEL